MSDSGEFDEIDCDHVLTGRAGRVLMLRTVTKEFVQLETQKQARLLANAKLWADGQRPSPEQFQGNEGRCNGENDRMLVAIKTHKIRLYGFIRSYRGVKTLIIADIDPAKKQNKAKKHILDRAKAAVVAIDKSCGD
jgi:hypothetical protein